jgi:hypothetical protein
MPDPTTQRQLFLSQSRTDGVHVVPFALRMDAEIRAQSLELALGKTHDLAVSDFNLENV